MISASDSFKPGFDISATELHEYLKHLPEKKRMAIFLRFWKSYTLLQVAKHLRVSWEQADFLIEDALRELKSKMKIVGERK